MLAGRDQEVELGSKTWSGLGPEFTFAHVTLFAKLKKIKSWPAYVSANNWVTTRNGPGRVVFHGKRMGGGCAIHSTNRVFTLLEYAESVLADVSPGTIMEVSLLLLLFLFLFFVPV